MKLCVEIGTMATIITNRRKRYTPHNHLVINEVVIKLFNSEFYLMYKYYIFYFILLDQYLIYLNK
jgi:hypothetical protein